MRTRCFHGAIHHSVHTTRLAPNKFKREWTSRYLVCMVRTRRSSKSNQTMETQCVWTLRGPGSIPAADLTLPTRPKPAWQEIAQLPLKHNLWTSGKKAEVQSLTARQCLKKIGIRDYGWAVRNRVRFSFSVTRLLTCQIPMTLYFICSRSL